MDNKIDPQTMVIDKYGMFTLIMKSRFPKCDAEFMEWIMNVYRFVSVKAPWAINRNGNWGVPKHVVLVNIPVGLYPKRPVGY